MWWVCRPGLCLDAVGTGSLQEEMPLGDQVGQEVEDLEGADWMGDQTIQHL